MQQTVSGVRFTGRWKEVADRGEEVTEALKEARAQEEDIRDWEAWRPREEDRIEEVRERTVEQARVGENTVEQDGKSAVDAAGEAVEGVEEAVGEMSAGRIDMASAEGVRAAKQFGLSLDTVLRKLVRSLETVVYRHVVARTNPFYFDGELVSARLEKRGLPFQGRDEFELSVDINDDAVKEEFSREIADRS